MYKKYLYLSSILSVLACISACSDDSTIGLNQGGTKAGLGQSCGDSILCDDSLFCEKSICVAHVNQGDNCDEHHLCTGELICDESGKCASKSPKDPSTHQDDEYNGELGSSCDNTHPCKSPLVCDSNRCYAKLGLGGPCLTDISCKAGTCVNEICSQYVGAEESCNPEKGILCEEPLKCHHESHLCYPVAGPGEGCFPYMQYCAEGYECIIGLSKCLIPGKIGDNCNIDDGYGCVEGLECIHEKCRKIVTDNCSEYEVCSSPSAVCYGGKCIESQTCESDDNCNADTYCCTEDACLVKNVCLPYGEGPRPEVNEECVYQTVAGLFEAAIQCEWTCLKHKGIFQKFNTAMMRLRQALPQDQTFANTSPLAFPFSERFWQVYQSIPPSRNMLITTRLLSRRFQNTLLKDQT